MVFVIIAALVIPPLVNPPHEQLNSFSSVASPFGLILSLEINGTQLAAGQGESLTAWLNSTSSEVANVTSASSWPIGTQGLWTRICTSGWPLGVGIMAGYFTSDNYSLGSLVRVPMPMIGCPVMLGTPGFFLMQPRGSSAIVKVNGALATWNLTSALGVGGSLMSSQRGGVYTAIAVDEWGDIALAHFRVNQ
jgi:hypothetical protein